VARFIGHQFGITQSKRNKYIFLKDEQQCTEYPGRRCKHMVHFGMKCAAEDVAMDAQSNGEDPASRGFARSRWFLKFSTSISSAL
jgi:hypothetical protein